MELPEAQEFLYPVSFTDHPDYYAIVGYPVELTTIHNRLTDDHYRSIDSVLWEVRQLEINARVGHFSSASFCKPCLWLGEESIFLLPSGLVNLAVL